MLCFSFSAFSGATDTVNALLWLISFVMLNNQVNRRDVKSMCSHVFPNMNGIICIAKLIKGLESIVSFGVYADPRRGFLHHSKVLIRT